MLTPNKCGIKRKRREFKLRYLFREPIEDGNLDAQKFRDFKNVTLKDARMIWKSSEQSSLRTCWSGRFKDGGVWEGKHAKTALKLQIRSGVLWALSAHRVCMGQSKPSKWQIKLTVSLASKKLLIVCVTIVEIRRPSVISVMWSCTPMVRGNVTASLELSIRIAPPMRGTILSQVQISNPL